MSRTVSFDSDSIRLTDIRDQRARKGCRMYFIWQDRRCKSKSSFSCTILLRMCSNQMLFHRAYPQYPQLQAEHTPSHPRQDQLHPPQIGYSRATRQLHAPTQPE